MSDGLHISLAAEQGAIGCCLMGGTETTFDAIERLPDEVFTSSNFVQAWSVIKQLASNGQDVNQFIFITEHTKKYGSAPAMVVMQSVDVIPSAANLPAYADELIDKYHRRCLLAASLSLRLAADDLNVRPQEALIDAENIIAKTSKTAHRFLKPKEIANAMVNDTQLRFDNRAKGISSGLLTGFTKLDEMTDGLQFGEMFVLGARPSQGKTALGLCIADAIALRLKVPSLIYTAEMSAESLARRLAAQGSYIPLSSLKTGSLNEGDFVKFGLAAKRIAESELYIVDCCGGISVDEIAVKTRAYVKLYGIKFVMLDYLQLIGANSQHEKRTYAVGEVSTKLKSIARTTGVAMLVLGQLNRESDKDKGRQPRPSDLGDSKQIEQDADAIGLIHRTEGKDPREPNCWLLLRKQRDGETGSIPLNFIPNYCRFENP